MSNIIVSVYDDGLEKIYFKIIKESDKVIVERPSDYSIDIPFKEDLKEQVATALIHIRREEESWKKQQGIDLTEDQIIPSRFM